MRVAAPIVFLDFDGTITRRDATDAILETFADRRWLEIEADWKAGRIGSRDCLSKQMALVSADPRDVDALLDGIDVDSGFVMLLDWCLAHRAPVQIVSDGFDYCIQRILSRPAFGFAPYLQQVGIVSSHLEPKGRQWLASFTAPVAPCVHGCATCKPAAMQRLGAGHAPVVFAGDGLSDCHAAAAADVVFAKDMLAAHCADHHVPFMDYADLADVARWLDDILVAGATTQPAHLRKAFPIT